LGNILINPAWRVYLIDHSRTFKNLETIKSEKELTYFSRSLMEQLRKLDGDSLAKCTHGYLRPPEIKTLLKRRDLILKYYDKKLAENGESITFP
ncbi:MAG TPA: hypothetical protein VJ521_04300, partial [Acidobacteriota bacterium]|nr:hypothetical protein [Acidobacteriota bacterium]